MSDYNSIIKDIKNKNFSTVYFLAGDEPYFIDKITEAIDKYALEEHEKDFNHTVLYGKETDISTVLSEAKRYPMMAERTVVMVKEAQHLRDISLLEKYLENPTPTTVLVFSYKYKKTDGRSKVIKALKKKAVYFESNKLREYELPKWITAFLKQKGYGITPKASVLLVEFLGDEIGKIVNELEKLFLVIPENSTIDEQVIEKNIGISKDFNNFELNKAIGQKDVLKANKIALYFSKNPKNHPLVVTISTLYNYFTTLLKYHYLKDKSNDKQVAGALGVHPFFVKEYAQAARMYNIKKCAQIIGYLREYDAKSKGVDNTSTSDYDLLKELLFKILH
tara:strand:- start:127799 stop:128803 length:1005 start_codon:yes stop_codon:yes gene_type:complete